MAFVEWDEKVKALAPDGADQSFAISIRFGCADRRFQDPDAETLHLGITGRENRIAVVEDESVRMIKRQKLAELLNRPFGSGMAGHVHIENASRTDFHSDEDIQDAERCSYRHEKIAGEWLRTKVVQRWLELPRGLPRFRYLPTVRGETRMPNFSDSSLAIRSSPHVGFSRAIRYTKSRRSFGSGGRPRLRDFHRQNILNAFRCHPTKVSGFTITNALRQSKSLASATIARRNDAVVRHGFFFRSWNKASCFRRKRFSATRTTRAQKNNRMNISNSVFYRNLCALLPSRPNFCGPQGFVGFPSL